MNLKARTLTTGNAEIKPIQSVPDSFDCYRKHDTNNFREKLSLLAHGLVHPGGEPG